MTNVLSQVPVDANYYQYNNVIPQTDVTAVIAASQTDAAIITAVAGKKIRVVSAVLSCNGATSTSVTFNTKPSGAGTAITNPIQLPLNSTVVLPESPSGYFTTLAGEGLTVTTGAGSNTSYLLTYILID